MIESSAATAAWERECAAWCRYLVDQEPSAALLARYADAHAQRIVATPACDSGFDRALVGFARRGSFCARLADAHARLFRPAGLLRRKLVLTLALLECDAAHHRRVDLVSRGSRAGFLLRCLAWAAGFALLSLAGLALFLPLRAWCSLRGEAPGSA